MPNRKKNAEEVLKNKLINSQEELLNEKFRNKALDEEVNAALGVVESHASDITSLSLDLTLLHRENKYLWIIFILQLLFEIVALLIIFLR